MEENISKQTQYWNILYAFMCILPLQLYTSVWLCLYCIFSLSLFLCALPSLGRTGSSWPMWSPWSYCECCCILLTDFMTLYFVVHTLDFTLFSLSLEVLLSSLSSGKQCIYYNVKNSFDSLPAILIHLFHIFLLRRWAQKVHICCVLWAPVLDLKLQYLKHWASKTVKCRKLASNVRSSFVDFF